MNDRHDTKPSPSRRNGAEVLDQGIAITGELLVKLMGMKLLPIKVRLLVSSKDLASELGLDWWRDEATERPVRDHRREKKRAKRDAATADAPDRDRDRDRLRRDRHRRRRGHSDEARSGSR